MSRGKQEEGGREGDRRGRRKEGSKEQREHQRNYKEENRGNWNKRGKSGTGKSEGKVGLLSTIMIDY